MLISFKSIELFFDYTMQVFLYNYMDHGWHNYITLLVLVLFIALGIPFFISLQFSSRLTDIIIS